MKFVLYIHAGLVEIIRQTDSKEALDAALAQEMPVPDTRFHQTTIISKKDDLHIFALIFGRAAEPLSATYITKAKIIERVKAWTQSAHNATKWQ